MDQWEHSYIFCVLLVECFHDDGMRLPHTHWFKIEHDDSPSGKVGTFFCFPISFQVEIHLTWMKKKLFKEWVFSRLFVFFPSITDYPIILCFPVIISFALILLDWRWASLCVAYLYKCSIPCNYIICLAGWIRKENICIFPV